MLVTCYVPTVVSPMPHACICYFPYMFSINMTRKNKTKIENMDYKETSMFLFSSPVIRASHAYEASILYLFDYDSNLMTTN